MQAEPMVRYRVPASTAEAELEAKQSLFIGCVARAQDEEQAQATIARVRARYPDGHHHAWAFRLTPAPQTAIGSSDDGEPGGTAGRPMLAALEGAGLFEAVAVVTRYFGGTKLGTGGLVRAYSGAVQAALERLPTIERVLHRLARIEVDYALYGQLAYHLPRLACRIEGAEYGVRVALHLAVPEERFVEAAELLREMTNGGIALAAACEGRCYVDSGESMRMGS